MRPHEVPYPDNDNAAIYGRYIGQRVLNVHRTYGGRLGHEPQPHMEGVLVAVESGCNGGLIVHWDGREAPDRASTQDCALVATYPAHRWTHEEY